MATYTPPPPWNGPYPQLVVDNFGNRWETNGRDILKRERVTTPPVSPSEMFEGFTCEQDTDHPGSVMLTTPDGPLARLSASLRTQPRFNFAAGLNGATIFNSDSANGDVFDSFMPYEFVIDNCKGDDCATYQGLHQALLVPGNINSQVGLTVRSEFQICDDTDTPLTAWLDSGDGSNLIEMQDSRPREISLPFGGRQCLPNGTYTLKLRLRLIQVTAWSDPNWVLRAQISSLDMVTGVDLNCCFVEQSGGGGQGPGNPDTQLATSLGAIANEQDPLEPVTQKVEALCQPILQVAWSITNTDTGQGIASFAGPPTGNAGQENAVLSGTYDRPVIDWVSLSVTGVNYTVTRTITDSCNNNASASRSYTFGLAATLMPVTSLSEPLAAEDAVMDGCGPIVTVSWLIEDATMGSTAFPVKVASFEGPPEQDASFIPEVRLGTYNNPVIDWQALGLTEGIYTVTRTITDSCGKTAFDESNEITL